MKKNRSRNIDRKRYYQVGTVAWSNMICPLYSLKDHSRYRGAILRVLRSARGVGSVRRITRPE